MIPRSRRDLFKDQGFASVYNAYTRTDKWPAGDAAGKVRGGDVRGSAPGKVQCRGTRRWGTVVGVFGCPVPEGGVYKKLSRRNQVVLGLGEVIRSNL